jgi:chaperonin GroEL
VDVRINLKSFGIEQLGGASRAVSTCNTITTVGGAGDKADIEARIRRICASIEVATSDYDRISWRSDLSSLPVASW